MISVVAAVILGAIPPGNWMLKDGSQAALFFYQPKEKRAWRPDGNYCDARTITQDLQSWEPRYIARDLLLFVRVKPALERTIPATIRFKVAPRKPFVYRDIASQTSGFASDGVSSCSSYFIGSYLGPPEDIVVGIGCGKFQEAGSVDVFRSGSGIAQSNAKGVMFGALITPRDLHGAIQLKQSETSIVVRPPSGFRDHDFRVVVTDNKGKLISAGAIQQTQRASYNEIEYVFELNFRNVAHVSFQVRPIEWTPIKGAHFRPN